MRNIILSVLLAAVVPMSMADCCHSKYYMKCDDHTIATPCCGYRPCDLFCCNCGGGCRFWRGPPATENLELKPTGFPIYPDGNTVNIFNDANVVGDGKLTLSEYLAWAKLGREEAFNETLWAGYFARFDRDNKGFVTIGETHRPAT